MGIFVRPGWLYGWKDIADYVGCSVRQAINYNKKFGMPISEIKTKKRIKPIGMRDEIDNWIKGGKEGGSFIYFIRAKDNGLIKIGCTYDLKERFSQINNNSPVELELLGAINGNVEIEKRLHKRFGEYRIKGEWFKPEKKLMNYINRVKKIS